MDGQPSRAAVEMVRALLSDDHCAAAGEAAVGEIISGVVRTGGVGGVADLAAELADKLAEMVEGVATGAGLAAIDLVDLLFVEGMTQRSDRVHSSGAPAQETPDDVDRLGG
jgi:hypothetical protein